MAQYLIVIVGIMASLAHADALRDPTTPALAWMPLASSEQARNLSPVLQSVIIGTQQHAAIINGQLVALGQQYEQYKLVKLTANTAVLRTAEGAQQVLTIQYPVKKSSTDSGKLLNHRTVKNK